jgi:hypothetical protein
VSCRSISLRHLDIGAGAAAAGPAPSIAKPILPIITTDPNRAHSLPSIHPGPVTPPPFRGVMKGIAVTSAAAVAAACCCLVATTSSSVSAALPPTTSTSSSGTFGIGAAKANVFAGLNARGGAVGKY